MEGALQAKEGTLDPRWLVRMSVDDTSHVALSLSQRQGAADLAGKPESRGPASPGRAAILTRFVHIIVPQMNRSRSCRFQLMTDMSCLRLRDCPAPEDLPNRSHQNRIV